jgi:hypothetical protein
MLRISAVSIDSARRIRPRPAGWALLATAVAYGLSQVQVWRVGLGWDESIYLSQVSRVSPAAFFSAPRARGITFLAAPLQLVSGSIGDLRIYLTVLSAVALFVSFRIWFAVLAPAAAVLAAAGFAGLWVTRFYGAELMPNLWVAFGLVAAVGGFLRVAIDRRDRIGLSTLPIGLAVAALMRPTDAAWAAAALLAMVVLVPGWRSNVRLLLLTGGGAAVGAAPWVIESYLRFGGVRTRLREASAIQGGLGWHPGALLQHWQTLDGPLLCRPCSPASTPPSTFWWLVIPVAVLICVLLARRPQPPSQSQSQSQAQPQPQPQSQARSQSQAQPQWQSHPHPMALALTPAVAGTAVAVPYLLLINYSAPRFLLPAIALFSLPVATAGHALAVRAPAALALVRRARRGSTGKADLTGILTGVLAGVLAVAMAGAAVLHVVSQQRVLSRQVTASARSTAVYPRLAADLKRLGVRPPCVVSGLRSPQIAFLTGCSSRNVGGHDGSISLAALKQLARHEPVVLVTVPGRQPPAYARDWQRRPLNETYRGRPWVAYLPPSG